ncbi:TPA: hypothetical protein ACPVZ6_001614 [Vibrio parahaemolyticus]|uniref:hypothetical protein n=3 Tax=Vibrio parahaemolyticus TaxID=670 RepID=UPI0004278C7A|nr:hypothetical protein [Vibrio parahaemolyticus]
MSKYTNLMMSLICHTVVKAPFFFSERFLWMKRLNWVAKDHFRHIDRNSENYKEIKTFSLFEPRLKWKAKAISTLTAISGDDAKSLLKWKDKQETFRKVNTDVSILRQGSHNIGFFKTGVSRVTFNIDAYLGVDSKYVESCNIYLITLDNGNYYISAYWFLKDEATLSVKDVDVSNIKFSSADYHTCNPFSSKFGHCKLPDKFLESQQLIINNIESIYSDIVIVEKQLFQLLGVSSRGNQAVALDIHVDESEPYYVDYNPEKDQKKLGELITEPTFRVDEHWVRRFHPYRTVIDNPDSREFLLKLPELDNSSIDLVFIKSQVKEEVEPHRGNDFAHRWYHPVGSHLTYLFIELVSKNYRLLDKKFSESLLSSYTDPKKSYQQVYKAFIEASVIENQIQSILSSQGVFRMEGDGSILEHFMNRAHLYLKNIKKTKRDIESKKTAANELVQAANLTYQKRMAWLVAGLAVVQIVIAVLSMDNFGIGDKITAFTVIIVDLFKQG